MTVLYPIFDQPGQAFAVALPDRSITFAELVKDIHVAANYLRSRNLGPKSTIAISLGSPEEADYYAIWIAHLASIRIGATHASIKDASSLNQMLSFTKVDALLGQVPGAEAAIPDLEHIPFDIADMTSFPEVSADDEAQAARLNFTSGTTGSPKLVEWNSAMMESRIDQVVDLDLIQANTWTASFLGQRTTAGFRYPLATWRAGGRVLLSLHKRTPDGALHVARSTLLVCSPFQLRFATEVPWPQRENRVIVVLGGRVPPKVRDAALARIASRIVVSYGSTETGSIASGDISVMDSHDGAVGWIRDGVEVQIVGEDKELLPAGHSGTIRVRTPFTVAAPDSDGWFEPGDRGILFADGLLAVEGRQDGVLNIGGAKLVAETVDAQLLAIAGVGDAAVSLTADGRLGVAVVLDGSCAAKEINSAVGAKLVRGLPYALIAMRQIPRNSMGKVDRTKLTETFAGISNRRLS